MNLETVFFASSFLENQIEEFEKQITITVLVTAIVCVVVSV